MAPPVNNMPDFFTDLSRDLSILRQFIWRDFKSRYVGTFIGLYWSILYPAVIICLFILIFPVFLKVRFPGGEDISDYALNLIAVLIPWISFQDSIFRATLSLVENPTLSRSGNLPLYVLPTSACISSMVHQLIAFTLFVIILGFYRSLSLSLLLLPFIFLLQLLFTLGLCLMFATFNVFFRDTQNIIGIIILVWMYLTPIFYPPGYFPENLSILLKLNFWAYLAEVYRGLILRGETPYFNEFFILSLFSIFIAIAGWYLFKSASKKIADYI